MPLVKVSLFQDPIEVPDDEVEVLRGQGLLAEVVADAPAAEPVKAAKVQPRKDEQQ